MKNTRCPVMYPDGGNLFLQVSQSMRKKIPGHRSHERQTGFDSSISQRTLQRVLDGIECRIYCNYYYLIDDTDGAFLIDLEKTELDHYGSKIAAVLAKK
ncbi:MAG: hypothetical protein IIA07_07685 [Proteobacteria bacterium]|nr:hypothetical protein [Pseudomonadota bacterium]